MRFNRHVAMLALVVVSGCRRAEIWVTPDAEIDVVEASHKSTRTHASAGKLAKIAYPQEGHDIVISAPGRSSIVAHIGLNVGECGYSSVVGSMCPNAKDPERRKHPLAWLREDGAPFELPRSGQGMILTGDKTRIVASVYQSSGSTRRSFELRPDREDRRSLPELVPIDTPGRYSALASIAGYDSITQEVTVEPGRYTWVHFMIGSKKAGGGNSSFIR